MRKQKKELTTLEKWLVIFFLLLLAVIDGLFFLYSYKLSFPNVLLISLSAATLTGLAITLGAGRNLPARPVRLGYLFKEFVTYAGVAAIAIGNIIFIKYESDKRLKRMLREEPCEYAVATVTGFEREHRWREPDVYYRVLRFRVGDEWFEQRIPPDYHIVVGGQRMEVRYCIAHPDMIEVTNYYLDGFPFKCAPLNEEQPF